MRCSFITFGCKINAYDTEAIREAVHELGYRDTQPGETPDLVVVNACTVTARAGRKGVAAVRRLSRRHPQATILVTGCLTEEDRHAIEQLAGVEHVIGNEEKDQIPALLMGRARVPVRGRRSRSIFRLRASRFREQTRAFLKIHDGCDSFCTYCIIPRLRGKSKSRSRDDVLSEARRFAASGHRELVLTGIHLSQYGKDLGIVDGLVDLMHNLRRIPGIERLRLSSIGEGAFTEAFLQSFEEDPGLCPFFHIPLQSGSNEVLRRMQRDYDAETYLQVVERVRARLPRAIVATDLMVGFPGESDADFEASLRVCRAARFAKIHIFPYSPRGRTRAARFEDHVAPAAKGVRVQRARELESELVADERRRWVGRRVEVLVERQRDGWAQGLSREGLSTRFPSVATIDLWNREVEVEVTGFQGTDLEGRLSDRRIAIPIS